MRRRRWLGAGEGPEGFAEAYRVVRTSLSVAMQELERPTVAITSARSGEGKTVTATNMARSMALSGRHVVLVDFDMRNPDAHRHVGGHNEFGATDVLLDRSPLADCLQYIEVGEGPRANRARMYLLSAGPRVSNPTELLGTRRAARLLETLVEQADVVLIDTPPVLEVADTLVLGRMVGGAVLVVEARQTQVTAVAQAKDALIRSQTRLLGVVVNKFQARDAALSYGLIPAAEMT
jgi:capsular exopolysaccharide synthesis family protein